MSRQAIASPLDCSRPAAWLFWFVTGSVLALLAMTLQSDGRWATLLRVGARNPLLAQIEHELGPVSPPDPIGHDGQLYYLVARDPLGRGPVPGAIASFDNNGPAYRYRRILLPMLAGGFGQFGGRLTLFGMMACLALSIGLATVSIADIAFSLRLPGEAAILASLNAGALVSAILLTVDAMALGLTLAGIALVLRSRFGLAAIAFALAALTKETFVVVPLALAVRAWRTHGARAAIGLAAVPAIPLAIWSAWVSARFAGAPGGAGNVGVPFAGMIESMTVWTGRHPEGLEAFFAAFAVATVAVAGVTLFLGRQPVLRAAMAPLLVLAVCSTQLVWGIPSNAARAFAILWPLGVVQGAQWLVVRRSTGGP